MKNKTRREARLLLATAAGVLVVMGGVGLFAGEPAALPVTALSTREPVYLSTSTLPVAVSGVVSATDSTIIYAETAGVVTVLPVKEGTVVTAGTVVARQSTPIADAQAYLAQAQKTLTEVQQAQSIAVLGEQETQAVYRTYSAKEIAALRLSANDTRMTEVSDQLVTVVEQGLLEAITAIEYVSENRPLFSASGLRQYDEVVLALYGRIPNYFKSSITRPHDTPSVTVTTLLDALRANTQPTPAELLAVTTLITEQLQALTNLFQTGEEEVFDGPSAYVTTAEQTAYFENRATILSTVESIETARAAFQQTADTVLEDAVVQETNVVVTTLDEAVATLQAEYAARIAEQSVQVASANVAVAAATQSLGVVSAPFSGVVTKVLADVGQYATAGTPLLELVGTTGRELVVTVSAQLIDSVRVGQPFMVAGAAAGQVTRIAGVAEGGSVQVIITLTAAAPTVGTGLSGQIMTQSVDVYAVPRSVVFFDTNGPYLTYEDMSTTPVEVVYDDGRSLYVTVPKIKHVPLKSATSLTL